MNKKEKNPFLPLKIRLSFKVLDIHKLNMTKFKRYKMVLLL